MQISQNHHNNCNDKDNDNDNDNIMLAIFYIAAREKANHKVSNDLKDGNNDENVACV